MAENNMESGLWWISPSPACLSVTLMRVPLVKFIKRILLFFIFVVLLPANEQVHSAVISDALKHRIAALRHGEILPVIIAFHKHTDYSRFSRKRSGAETMIRSLQEDARLSQAGTLKLLADELHASGVRPFWINNTISVAVTSSIISKLNRLPEVESIDIDDAVGAIQDWRASSSPPIEFGETSVPWNISRINADSVWMQYGLDGSGIIIGMMDSGIDTSHPAVRSRWRGGSNSWYDAINYLKNPYDDLGHGVATTGIVLGGDGPGPDANDIGIAFNSRFIAAKMLSSGFSTISQLTDAAQWILDPDGNPSTNDFPDVINNSWISNTRGSTYFYTAASAWRAAGIIPVFIAGNSGPDTGTTLSPGDYNNCLSFGGTNSADGPYSATSVGPSAAGPQFPSDRRKPDFSAPGELVVTSFLGGGYGQASGTSFAGPHATGTIALLLQADQSLTYADVYSILRDASVDLGAQGYDYVFGYGRIDALRAVRLTLGRRIVISPDSVLVTTSEGGSAFFALRLAVPPTADVTISFASSDTAQGEPSPSSVIFTTTNWNIPQTIQITGRGNTNSTVDVPYRIIPTSSSKDQLYNKILPREIHLINKATGVTGVHGDNITPHTFTLLQNYPNPFNPITVIRYELPENSMAQLNVYDVIGRHIATLVNERQNPGYKSVNFDASNLANGVYFYRLDAGTFHQTKKMILIK